MKADIEVLEILRHEINLYKQAVVHFEKQLKECGIYRNGSRIIVEPRNTQHTGTPFANAASLPHSQRAAALRAARMRMIGQAEQTIHTHIQNFYKTHKSDTAFEHNGALTVGNAGSNREYEGKRIAIIDNRKRRGGLSRIHQEQYGP